MTSRNSEAQNYHWYSEIAKIRVFEENIARYYPREVFRCPVHLAIGHEASAVGICSALTVNDLVLSYHRSHHHFLAKGGTALSLLNELLGNPNGCSGGRGGSTHLFAPEVGFMGSTAIISGTLPVATGLAHSLKLKKSPHVVVSFSGDASIEEGVFFESVNLASLWQLPILFVIEDNDLSCYTSKKIRQSVKKFSKIADLFEIFYDEQDGSRVEDVYKSAVKIINSIKQHSKPGILKINVYRAHEHCGPDQDNHLLYRNVLGHWPDKDPLSLLSKSLNKNETDKILEKITTENNDLFRSILNMERKND